MATATEACFSVSKKSTQWIASRNPRPAIWRRLVRGISEGSRRRATSPIPSVAAAIKQRQKTRASPVTSIPATMIETKPQREAISAIPRFHGFRRKAPETSFWGMRAELLRPWRLAVAAFLLVATALGVAAGDRLTAQVHVVVV